MQVGQRERRVGQPEPEGEGDVGVGAVVAAVADEQPLAVAHGLGVAGEVEVGRVVLQAVGNRLGEPARGVDRAGQDVGDGAARGLAAEPRLDERGGVRDDVAQHDRRSVDQHDDDVGVGRRDPLQRGDLVGGQVHVGAVEALRLVGGGQPDHHDHGVGGGRDGHGFGAQGVVVGVVVGAAGTADAVARREGHLGEGGSELVERGLHLGRDDLGAARALVARSAGELADHRDPAAGRQWEDRGAVRAWVVLQQHDRLRRGCPGQAVVGLGVEVLVEIQHTRSLVHQRQHVADPGVEHPPVQLPGLHGRHDLVGTAGQRGRHLQVEPGLGGRHPVVDRAPVGHDQAGVPPLLPQHGGQQPRVLRGREPVDLVVGAHDRPRWAGRDDPLERGQVDLAQRALVDTGVDAEPVALLVVGREVLHRRAHTMGLDALDDPEAQLARQVRVLGEVLEVAPAERRPLHVDPRAEDHREVDRPRLLGQRGADPTQQLRVPGRRHRRRGGEAGRRDAAAEPEVVPALRLGAQPVRAVRDHDLRDPQPLDRRGVPEPGARRQRRLLRQGQLRQERVDVEAHGYWASGRSFTVVGTLRTLPSPSG